METCFEEDYMKRLRRDGSVVSWLLWLDNSQWLHCHRVLPKSPRAVVKIYLQQVRWLMMSNLSRKLYDMFETIHLLYAYFNQQ